MTDLPQLSAGAWKALRSLAFDPESAPPVDSVAELMRLGLADIRSGRVRISYMGMQTLGRVDSVIIKLKGTAD